MIIGIISGLLMSAIEMIRKNREIRNRRHAGAIRNYKITVNLSNDSIRLLSNHS